MSELSESLSKKMEESFSSMLYAFNGLKAAFNEQYGLYLRNVEDIESNLKTRENDIKSRESELNQKISEAEKTRQASFAFLENKRNLLESDRKSHLEKVSAFNLEVENFNKSIKARELEMVRKENYLKDKLLILKSIEEQKEIEKSK